jgi:hypothetical protein
MIRKIFNKIPRISPSSRIFHISFLAVCAIVLVILYYYYGSFPIDEKVLGLRPFFLFEIKYHVVGSLFYLPLIYAFIVFRWQGVFVTWLAFWPSYCRESSTFHLFFHP